MVATPIVAPVMGAPIGGEMILAAEVVQMISETAVAGQPAACATGGVVATMAREKRVVTGMIAEAPAVMAEQRLRIVAAQSLTLPHSRQRALMGAADAMSRTEGIDVVLTGGAGVRPVSTEGASIMTAIEPPAGLGPHVRSARTRREGIAAVILVAAEVLPAIHSAAGIAAELASPIVAAAGVTATIVTAAVIAPSPPEVATAKVAATEVTAPEVTAPAESVAATMPAAESTAVAAAKSTAMAPSTTVAAPAAMTQRGCGIGQAQQNRGDKRRTHRQNARAHRTSPLIVDSARPTGGHLKNYTGSQ
jgi:hypothetical protein